MISDILNKAQVEKDEGLEALPRVLIVDEGPCQICFFSISIFFVVILAQTNLKAHAIFFSIFRFNFKLNKIGAFSVAPRIHYMY